MTKVMQFDRERPQPDDPHSQLVLPRGGDDVARPGVLEPGDDDEYDDHSANATQ